MADLYAGMTPADILDDLGNAIAERYRDIERRVGQELRKALSDAITEPTDLRARLLAVRNLKEQAWKLTSGMDPDEMARVVSEIAAGQASAEIARQLLNIPALAGSTITAGGLWAVAASELDLRDQLRALNERIYRAPADAYQRMTASMNAEILAGRQKWEKVHERQVARYLSEGISGFVDVSGRRWPIGSYAEMATRTAASRAWRDQSIASMNEAGIETFTPVIGNDACSQCGAWVGKVLTATGPTGTIVVPHALTAEPTEIRVDGTLVQARAQGWGHPNCRCVLTPALPGLERYMQTTHDPEAERARDRMRELERDVRDAKRDGSRDDVREAQRALKAHTDDHGLRRRSYREQLRFADGPGTGGARPAPTRPTRPRTPTPATNKTAAKPAASAKPKKTSTKRAAQKKWTDDLPKLERPESYAEASYSSNPGAVRNTLGRYPAPFHNNCHQVVNAMELRARGFDVRAAETAAKMGRATYSISSDWVDPVTGRARDIPNPNPKARSLNKVFKDATADWPDGARGFVSGQYKRTVGGGGGHIFNVEKIDGKLRMAEGQVPGSAYDTVRNFSPSSIQIFRVDDLVPTQNVSAMVAANDGVIPAVTAASQRAYITRRINAIEEQGRQLENGTYSIGDDPDRYVFTSGRIRNIWSRELAELRKTLRTLPPEGA